MKDLQSRIKQLNGFYFLRNTVLFKSSDSPVIIYNSLWWFESKYIDKNGQFGLFRALQIVNRENLKLLANASTTNINFQNQYAIEPIGVVVLYNEKTDLFDVNMIDYQDKSQFKFSFNGTNDTNIKIISFESSMPGKVDGFTQISIANKLEKIPSNFKNLCFHNVYSIVVQ